MIWKIPDLYEPAKQRVLSVYPKAEQMHLGDGWQICESGFGSKCLHHCGGFARSEYWDAWIALDEKLRLEADRLAVIAMNPSAYLSSKEGYQVLHCNCPDCNRVLSGIWDTPIQAWCEAATTSMVFT